MLGWSTDIPSQLCLAGLLCQGICGLRVTTAPLISQAKACTLRLETHSSLPKAKLDQAFHCHMRCWFIQHHTCQFTQEMGEPFPLLSQPASDKSAHSLLCPLKLGSCTGTTHIFRKKCLKGLVDSSTKRVLSLLLSLPFFFFLFFSNGTMHWELREEEERLDYHGINK